MRMLDKFALVTLILLAIIGKLVETDELDPGGSVRRPDPGQFAPTLPHQTQPDNPIARGRQLSPAQREDPGVIVPVGDKQATSSGTAFSVNSDGVWITARHVADGCDLVALRNAKGKFVRVHRRLHHPNADISVLWTRGGVAALPMLKKPLHANQDGYSFGYPKGKPGDVYAQVIGRMKMHQRGRYRTNEPIVAWAHIRRVPDRGAHLGGISGGPWVNAEGRILGVHVAGNPRRGRSYSTAPSSLRTIIANASIEKQTDLANISISRGNFPEIGNQLRKRLIVAKVVCLVGERWRQ